MTDQAPEIPAVYNIEAEQAVLGSLMTDATRLSKLDFLQTDHFYEPVHARIFKAICDLADEGKLADVILLKNQFDNDECLEEIGGASYLAKIAGRASAIFNIVDYAELIFDLARKRTFGAAIAQAQNIFVKQGANLDLEKELNVLTDTFLDFSIKSKKFEVRKSKKVTQQIIDQMLEKTGAVYSTGLDCLDKSLGGGISSETSIAIGGDTGMGKTMLLGTIAYNMAKEGIPVLYVAAEMGDNQIHQRMLARMMNVNAIGFKVKRNDADFCKKIIEAQASEDLNLYYRNAPGIELNDLKRVIVSTVRRFKIRCVFVDYLQLIQGCPPKTSQASHQENVAQWLADVTKQEGIATIYAAQVGTEDKFRGGGIKYGGDYNYIMKKITDPNRDKGEAAYLLNTKSRHTIAKDLGDKHSPSLLFARTGSHLEDYSAPYDMKDEIST